MAARPRNSSTFTLFMTSLFFMAGCGGSTPEPEEPAAAPDEQEVTEEDISDDEAALLAQIEESAAIADAEAAASGEPASDGDGPPERELTYRVSQDSLKVLVEGAEFVPKVEAVRVAGRWGVKVTLEATTTGERNLYSDENGPMAFGGYVIRGTREKFGDERKGGGLIKLTPGPAVQFSQTWPESGQKGLAPGEQLELHVGLWGFGSNDEDTRPIHRFVVVRMTASQAGAIPVVQPPN